jgi:hypothetical protein
MAVIDSGSNSAGKANVDANYNLQAVLPGNTATGVAQGGGTAAAGFAAMLSEVDSGSVTGSRLVREPEVSQDYRVRVGMDTLLFSDTFNASAQNTSLWSYTFNTMTAAQPGAGTVNFGTVQGTTSAHGAFMRTFQHFPLFGTFPLAVEFHVGQFTAALTANEVWRMGLGLPAAATTAPTDGVWLEITSAGVIGSISFANTTTQTGTLLALNSLTVGDLDKFIIVVGERTIEFWRDNTLLGTLSVPNANGQPFVTTSLPVFMHKYNTGAVSNTNTMRVADVNVTLMDALTSRDWPTQLCALGQMAYQGQNGGTMGTTALLPNATAATTVTGTALSQTVAIATGLGGQAGITAGAAGVDGCVTAFQSPIGSTTQTPRNLIIKGVRIDAVNIGAAVATTATVMQWSLGFGAIIAAGTLPSLAQAESASFTTATAKAWRRIPLGVQSWVVGAAIGAAAEQITINFSAPIVVHPGQWVAAVAKFIVGTATASQVIWATVAFDAYYE